MEYELKVSLHKEGDRDDYYGITLYQQLLMDLDLPALARFLNQPTREATLADLKLNPALVEIVTNEAIDVMQNRFGPFTPTMSPNEIGDDFHVDGTGNVPFSQDDRYVPERKEKRTLPTLKDRPHDELNRQDIPLVPNTGGSAT